MNSDEMWLLYLFSGTFAGVISGGVAALVAMLVLRKTNEHQTNLATIEGKQQDIRADDQLGAQRAGLELQLEKQREGLELQLQEQRNEASQARQISAAADLASAIQALPSKIQDGDSAISEVGLRAQGAAIRWQIESPNDELGKALANFAVYFVNRTMELSLEEPPFAEPMENYELLVQIGELFSDGIVRLSRSRDPERDVDALALIQNLTAGLGHPKR